MDDSLYTQQDFLLTVATADSAQDRILDDDGEKAGTLFDSRIESGADAAVFSLYNASNDVFLIETTATDTQTATATETDHDGHDHSLDDYPFDSTLDAGTGGGGAAAGKPTATPAQFADYLINGFWQDVGGSARSWTQDNITYSLSNEFTAAQKTGFRMAFDQWADVADITFTEVASGGNIDVREGDDGGAYSSSSTSGSTIVSNFISIDTAPWYWQNFNDIGDYALLTAIHEIGHSLGLGHSGNYNGSADYATDATWANDTRQYSVMSYFDADNSGADHSDAAGWQYGSTPALYDILAIQTIYGADYTVRSGNTTYGFNSNAGRDQFNFTLTDDPVVAIWDGGGTDTLDLSGYSVAQTIRLTAGEFSDIGGMTGNLAIAFGATIENAVGGSGVDNIYGSTANNNILGGNGDDIIFASTGNDTLNGQAGTDTANYSAYSVSAFAFNFIDSVTVAFTHIAQAWNDTISNIENFIFSDGAYTFSQLESAFNVNNFAPVLTANNVTLTQGTSAAASASITATDADGNVLNYEVWDGGKSLSTGYFELNGAKLSAGIGHTLTQSEFSSLNIVGGGKDGVETFWVRATDGVHTTAWKSFSLTTSGIAGGGAPNTAPTMNVGNLSLGFGSKALASTVITAADADNDPLSYTVWDSGTQSYSGYFELAGQRLAAGVNHILTQAQFNTLQIVGGSMAGSDTLWAKVSDGEASTLWKSFTLSTVSGGGGGGGGGNTAPVLTASNISLDAGQSALASSVVSGSDADGNPLTWYVWDGGTTSISGYFSLGGTRLSAGVSHTLTQAQFDTLQIVGGSAAGTETLWARVSDGTETTAWKQFTLTTTQPAAINGADILDMGTGDLIVSSESQTTNTQSSSTANSSPPAIVGTTEAFSIQPLTETIV